MITTKSKKYLVITGGGTGGHVFPALSIADEFITRGYQVCYVGSRRGLEAKLAPEHNIPFVTIETGQIKNKGPIKMVLGLLLTLRSLLWSLFFLIRRRPTAIIGVGGYVSVPVCFAGALLRVPLYLQEQNVSVGIANRFLGRFAKNVFLGFEKANRYFPKKSIVSGNPIRKVFYRKDFHEYQSEQKRLLIMGGSQGARAINLSIVDLLPRLESHFPNLKIQHQTGSLDFETVDTAYKKSALDAQVVPFIDAMAEAYQQSTLIIARSGALTVSEIIAVRRPCIFVPYPRKGQNDQTANAYFMKSLGLAEVVEQGDSFTERLWDQILQCFQAERLQAMFEAFSQLHHFNAVATIGDHIQRDTSL